MKTTSSFIFGIILFFFSFGASADGAAGSSDLANMSESEFTSKLAASQASQLAPCLAEVNANNQKLTDACNKDYCADGTYESTDSRCTSICIGKYGYRNNGGYIHDVTSFCQGPDSISATWVAPPKGTPMPANTDIAAKKSSGPTGEDTADPAAKKAAAAKPDAEDSKPAAKASAPEKKSSSSCSSDLANAESSCNQQASTPNAQQGGINGACQQMTNAGVSASQQWTNIATSCSSAISKCKNSCEGDDLSKCSNLQSLVDNAFSMANNSSSAAGNSGLGCQQQSGNGMNPSSTGGNGNNNNNNAPQMQAVAAPGGVDCTNPVNEAQCSIQKSDTAVKDTTGNNSEMQQASAGSSGHNNGSGFNVGDPGTQAQNAQFGEHQPSGSSGAGMSPPMGSSGSGFNFGSNGNQGGGASPNRMPSMAGANKTNADVLHGEGGRSGYSSPVSRSIASISGGHGGMHTSGFGSLGGGSGDDMGRMRGLDLKQYLPGGAKDGTRRLSGVNFAHPDIHSQNENVWTTISNRFQIHCKLQLLYDCH